ncbi:MAG: hypothetical protein SFW35_04015 [Chitinophagales bacterium]|nr:hypothetical protein [Chitinophagales bacterium]
MKYVWIAGIALVLSSCSKELVQDASIPAQARNYVSEQYGDAKNLKWQKTGKRHNAYIATFDSKGKRTKLKFDAQGSIMSSEKTKK